MKSLKCLVGFEDVFVCSVYSGCVLVCVEYMCLDVIGKYGSEVRSTIKMRILFATEQSHCCRQRPTKCTHGASLRILSSTDADIAAATTCCTCHISCKANNAGMYFFSVVALQSPLLTLAVHKLQLPTGLVVLMSDG